MSNHDKIRLASFADFISISKAQGSTAINEQDESRIMIEEAQ